MHERTEFGLTAESIATAYLSQRGYEILERNYRKPWGEIDIIARMGDVVVFVEVKANSKEFTGDFNPEIRVNRAKMNKITKTATLYLGYELKNLDTAWRVDIISVTTSPGVTKAKITHFKNVAESFF